MIQVDNELLDNISDLVKDKSSSALLNIFADIHSADIAEIINHASTSNAKYLFDNGIISLKAHLSDYDAGGWTYYDALGNVAVKKYHHIHVVQLLQLYEITGDTMFLEYHNKWRGYENTPPTFFNRAILAPGKLAIAIYILNFMWLFAMSEIVIFSIDKIKKRIIE